MKRYIEIIDEGVTYDVENEQDCITAIMEEYRRHDVCIGEMLYRICIVGFSVQEVVDIFATIMYRIEEDLLIQIVEGEPVRRSLKE